MRELTINCPSLVALHVMELAARSHHNVPAGALVHDGGARLLADHILRACGAARADAADDQDLQ